MLMWGIGWAATLDYYIVEEASHSAKEIGVFHAEVMPLRKLLVGLRISTVKASK